MTDEGRRFGGPARWISWILMVAPVVALGALGWHRRWLGDDGFINLRVAGNLLAGHGMVFNVGERVEAATSPLWVGVIAAVGATGVRLEHAAVYTGLVLTLLGVVMALWGLRMLQGPSAGLTVPLGVLAYVAVVPAWEYATSGLETGLSLAWMGTGFAVTAVLAREQGQPRLVRWLAAGALLGLGPIVRPELALLSAGWFVLLAAGLWTRSASRRWVRVAALFTAFGAVPVSYQVFRMGYFAGVVPATALAKSAFDSNWAQGLHYLDNFFGRYLLWIPLIAVVLVIAVAVAREVAARRWMVLGARLVPFICGALYCGYVVMAGGGFMHGRLFLPGLFAVVISGGWVVVGRSRKGALLGVLAALVLAWSVYCAWTVRHPVENEHWIGDERGWHARVSGNPNPVLLSDYEKFPFVRDGRRILAPAERLCPSKALPRTGAPGHGCDRAVLVDFPRYGKWRGQRRSYPIHPDAVDDGIIMVAMRGAMGMIGQLLGPDVLLVDHRGLSDPVAARLEVTRRGRPGHEKGLSNAWMVGRYAQATPGEDPRVADARAAASCGALRELLAATRGPMTWARFFSNLSQAFSFHRLKVPVDPRTARRKFCGSQPGAVGPGGR